MPNRFVFVLLTLVLASAPLHAAGKKLPAAKPAAVPVDPDVTTYYVCVLSKGLYAGVGLKEERQKTQAAQTAYINRLAHEGKLLVSGPCTDDSDWRGLYIFKCASLSEARTLVNADPEVLAGRLKFELHPWMTAKGLIHDPEFSGAK